MIPSLDLSQVSLICLSGQGDRLMTVIIIIRDETLTLVSTNTAEQEILQGW